MATQIKPKISANKLGEYIQSSPKRRRQIVSNQKYPKKYIVTRYSAATKAIVDFFTKGKGNKKEIEERIAELLLKNSSSSFQNQDTKLSIKALEIFTQSQPPDFNKFYTERLNGDLNKLSIKGVDVSVRPNILIRGYFGGNEFIGAIKLHFSKTNPLEAQSGKYVSTLIHRYLEENYSEKVRPDFCISMDIFTGKYFKAPRSFKSLRKEIEAACSEIRLLWSDL